MAKTKLVSKSEDENVEALKARIAELEKIKSGEIIFKIGEKGGLSVYGLGQRFPVTLYYEQWMSLIAAAPQLKAFLEENKSQLKLKDQK